MSTLWPKALEVLVVPQSYQTQLSDVSQAHNTALGLLVVLNQFPPQDNLTIDTDSMLVANRWTLDICRRLLMTSRSCFDSPSPNIDRILSSLLCRIFEAHPLDDPANKVERLLDLFVEILWAFKHYGGTALHVTLSEKTHYLLRDNQHPQIISASKRRLLPLLEGRASDDTGKEHDDFEVSAYYHTSARQVFMIT